MQLKHNDSLYDNIVQQFKSQKRRIKLTYKWKLEDFWI